MRAHATVFASRRAILLIVPKMFVRVDGSAVRQVLRAREARDGVASGAGDDVAFEQHGDGLERHALGLGHAEDGVDDHGETRAAEDKEGPVSDGIKHYWCKLLRVISDCWVSYLWAWFG